MEPQNSPQTDSKPTPELTPDLLAAVRAAQSRKALDLKAFDLRGVTSLTDYFLICSGTNSRQNQAIADAVEEQMREKNNRNATGMEGYDKGDWILVDFGDFMVHIFSEQARKYYEIERLWRQATEIPVPDDEPPLRPVSTPEN